MSLSGIEYLRRYQEIVDDLEAFLEAAQRPLPKVVWANPLRGSLEETAARILVHCPRASSLSWRPGAWRIPPEERPGHWPEHLLGRIHVQEEASLLAGDLMQAQPGERILDLCAAPGGKSAQMAIAMKDQGFLLANERSFGRLSPLRRTLDRMGVTCAAVSCMDGVRLPLAPGSFDGVFVDAPCSCEGTSRKSGARQHCATTERFRDSLSQVQRALLRKAVKFCRPGGRIVYSTCTYAPEENEAVLNIIPQGEALIEALPPFSGLKTAPGISTWGDQHFRADIGNALRIWPHHNDTGGFFLARLKRL